MERSYGQYIDQSTQSYKNSQENQSSLSLSLSLSLFIYIYIYVCMSLCVCVCVCVCHLWNYNANQTSLICLAYKIRGTIAPFTAEGRPHQNRIYHLVNKR